MESYAWYLAHEIAGRGYLVTIICESFSVPKSSLIDVRDLGPPKGGPRWRQMMSFRKRVQQYIEANFDRAGVIIHSHERAVGHDITTFHGEPFKAKNFLGSLFGMISPRAIAWRAMEFDEVSSASVRWVLPVSNRIKDQLLKVYPAMKSKSIAIAMPGIMPQNIDGQIRCLKGYRCVFVGREWKRKGLDVAVESLKLAKQQNPLITLDVYGVNAQELPSEFRNLAWITSHGWVSTIPWKNYDLLIHLARREPFGMVVAEARQAGVPVVCSNDVGAIDLGLSDVFTIDSAAEFHSVASIVVRSLQLRFSRCEVVWTWPDLADFLIGRVYDEC